MRIISTSAVIPCSAQKEHLLRLGNAADQGAGETPALETGSVHIGVADAAIKNLDLDIARPRLAPLEAERTERRGGAPSGISKAGDHGCISLLLSLADPKQTLIRSSHAVPCRSPAMTRKDVWQLGAVLAVPGGLEPKFVA